MHTINQLIEAECWRQLEVTTSCKSGSGFVGCLSKSICNVVHSDTDYVNLNPNHVETRGRRVVELNMLSEIDARLLS